MTDATLAAQMTNFDRAVLYRDAELACSVLHSDDALVPIQPVPAVFARDRWLQMLPDYIVNTWDVQEAQVDVLDGCATVLQRIQMTAAVAGEDRSGLFVITDVWCGATRGGASGAATRHH